MRFEKAIAEICRIQKTIISKGQLKFVVGPMIENGMKWNHAIKKFREAGVDWSTWVGTQVLEKKNR